MMTTTDASKRCNEQGFGKINPTWSNLDEERHSCPCASQSLKRIDSCLGMDGYNVNMHPSSMLISPEVSSCLPNHHNG